VELRVFSETSTQEVREAITKLQAEGAKGIVLDMRLNSGGLLEEGVSVSDLFLESGQPVVDTRGRFANNTQQLVSSREDEFTGLPVVVVVGPQSASATEIVAGALQDHDRALILGRPTFGKGSVQTVFRMPDNNWLKITTARWYTPSGRSIQRPYGIDQPLIDETAEGAAAIEMSSEVKPEYHTDGGRVVYGGGGIHPDLTVWPDTTTIDERALIEVLQTQDWPKFIETRFAFGVEYSKENPDLKPGFPVTDELLNSFYDRLTSAGFEADRGVYEAGKRWIGYQIASEITFSKWGEEQRRRRENSNDPQIRTAVELLRQATSPASLFSLAAGREGANQARGELEPAGHR
jgi:carboxyl-terminal processing protease